MPGTYLDHAASTPMRPDAVAAMQPFLAHEYGNPSGGHRAAQATKRAVEAAREQVAEILGARPDEIVFTGGGSEADNLAVKGVWWAARARGLDGVATSAIEHKAVLGATSRLAAEGARVSVVGAGSDGVIDVDELAALLDDRTAIVSVMLVNNETGVVQPLDEIASAIADGAPNAVLHTDAVQAPQWLDLRVAAARASLVSVSGHKFGGPKGVGALVVRDRTPLVPLVEGGGHEWSLRAGTHNVAGIVAFAAALAATDRQRADECDRIGALRDDLESRLASTIVGVETNGDPARRVPGLLHVAIAGVEAETLLVALDQHDVYAASGSACSSGAVDPSHVLIGMGMDRVRALSSVRFSLGWASTADDVARAVPVIERCVTGLRAAAA